MTKRMSATDVKAHLSAVLAEVAYAGRAVIIERHGRPIAAIIGLNDFARIAREEPSDQPRGALALVGAWRDVGDDVIDALVADVYAQRERDRPRLVGLAE